MSRSYKKRADEASTAARQTGRSLQKEQRNMDRERRKLETEEKKIIAKIKEAHKKGDKASAKIYGASTHSCIRSCMMCMYACGSVPSPDAACVRFQRTHCVAH